MRYIISGLFFLLIGITLSAQNYTTIKTTSKKALKAYEKGKELSRARQDAKALEQLDKAINADPKFIDAYIEYGAVKYSQGHLEETEKTLEKVIDLDPYYNTKLLYTLGFIEQKLGKCNEAIEHLDLYIEAPKARESLIAKAKDAKENCLFMISMEGKEVSFEFDRMSPNINTRESEYFPSISADEETFFFTRVVKGQEDIFYCKKMSDGTWGPAKAMDNINSNDNEGNQSFSADGKSVVFTACNRRNVGYGSCDIYYSQFKNGKWTLPVNMGRAINSEDWESQPCLSADGMTLYFTSKRKGSDGKADIYVSHQNDEGAWSIAKPIKGKINTKGHEQTPFIHPDGKTLYFKSDGHPGFGGLDIFMSKLQDDGTWGEPINLGKPINTVNNEGSFTVSLDGEYAYFDSDKFIKKEKGNDGVGFNRHDIYQLKLDESIRPEPVTYVKAKVIDAESKKPLVAKVEFMDLSIQKRHAYSLSDENGEFLVCLPVGTNYSLNVSKENYLFSSENFELNEDTDLKKPFELVIELQKIPPALVSKPTSTQTEFSFVESKPIILKNIFFNTGSAELKQESETELQKLYDLLNEQSKIKIQIEGHTDNVGSDSDNQTLSENRAKAVYTYLIEKGINPNRLRYKGYGESQPIDTNETKEGRKNNRRTAFIIL